MQKTPFDQLVKQFARLPGLGPRSAKRVVLHLLTQGRGTLDDLANALTHTATQLKTCAVCGNLDTIEPCQICADPRRDESVLCIVASVADLWAIERTSAYKGRYHVLGGLLSALDGIGPEDLTLAALAQRLQDARITEMILALSATIDGQTTAHYITDLAQKHHNLIKITRLAHGMPVGGELDYLDDGTIMTALKSRGAV